MMTLLYAEPSRGKTLAALAAFPNAKIATTKMENIVEPARLYGLNVEANVTVVSTVGELAAFCAASKDAPKIIDDVSDLLEKILAPIEKAEGSPDCYNTLNSKVIPLFRALSERAKHPTVITAWARPPAMVKDVAGDKQLQPGGWAAPGGKMRTTIPGLCTHYLRVSAQEPRKASWPFEFQTTATKLWEAKCRAPAAIPEEVPLALSAIYRAAGYECDSMFPDQPKVREAAYKILQGADRAKAKAALGKVFERAVGDGANAHAVAYAVTEAQCQIVLENHAAGLVSSLAGNFF